MDTYEIEESNYRYLCLVSCFAIAIIALIIAIVVSYMTKPDTLLLLQDKPCADLEILKQKYSTQNDVLWDMLSGGIKSVTIDQHPTPYIYLLAYFNESNEQMVKDIVGAIGKCLNTGHNPVMLSHKDLEDPEIENDYGVFIEKYRIPLEESQVMLVEDVNKVKIEI